MYSRGGVEGIRRSGNIRSDVAGGFDLGHFPAISRDDIALGGLGQPQGVGLVGVESFHLSIVHWISLPSNNLRGGRLENQKIVLNHMKLRINNDLVGSSLQR